MASTISPDDHPNYTIRRERNAGVVGAAASSFVQFQFFQKSRIHAVHAVVLTAGTATATPADAALEVSMFGPGGTSSIGNLAYGTHTAQHLLHATLATVTVAANNGIRFAKKLDATGVTLPYVEYEVLPDAVQS